MRRKQKMFLIFFLTLFLTFFLYLFFGEAPKQEEIIFGVNFSQKHAQDLGLNWKKVYLALLDDLKVREIKLAAHWDLIEPEKDKFNFSDLDWQIKTAEEKGAKLLLVIGMKTGRWPECHIPEWAKNLSKKEQQKEILEMIKEVVLRYKNSSTIERWQVENEPFFPFGVCPWVDREFLKKEISLVKSLDKKREIVISDSGEGSFWLQAAYFGDIVGTTMYRKVWVRQLGIYLTYPFPPVFYWRKAQIIKKLFGKDVICIELQTEPWGPKLLYDSPLEEQQKTMNLEQFKKNIDFAKRTGLKEFYLWGAEWWYWLKAKQGDFAIWDKARELWY